MNKYSQIVLNNTEKETVEVPKDTKIAQISIQAPHSGYNFDFVKEYKEESDVNNDEFLSCGDIICINKSNNDTQDKHYYKIDGYKANYPFKETEKKEIINKNEEGEEELTASSLGYSEDDNRAYKTKIKNVDEVESSLLGYLNSNEPYLNYSDANDKYYECNGSEKYLLNNSDTPVIGGIEDKKIYRYTEKTNDNEKIEIDITRFDPANKYSTEEQYFRILEAKIGNTEEVNVKNNEIKSTIDKNAEMEEAIIQGYQVEEAKGKNYIKIPVEDKINIVNNGDIVFKRNGKYYDNKALKDIKNSIVKQYEGKNISISGDDVKESSYVWDGENKFELKSSVKKVSDVFIPNESDAIDYKNNNEEENVYFYTVEGNEQKDDKTTYINPYSLVRTYPVILQQNKDEGSEESGGSEESDSSGVLEPKWSVERAKDKDDKYIVPSNENGPFYLAPIISNNMTNAYNIKKSLINSDYWADYKSSIKSNYPIATCLDTKNYTILSFGKLEETYHNNIRHLDNASCITVNFAKDEDKSPIFYSNNKIGGIESDMKYYFIDHVVIRMDSEAKDKIVNGRYDCKTPVRLVIKLNDSGTAFSVLECGPSSENVAGNFIKIKYGENYNYIRLKDFLVYYGNKNNEFSSLNDDIINKVIKNKDDWDEKNNVYYLKNSWENDDRTYNSLYYKSYFGEPDDFIFIAPMGEHRSGIADTEGQYTKEADCLYRVVLNHRFNNNTVVEVNEQNIAKEYISYHKNIAEIKGELSKSQNEYFYSEEDDKFYKKITDYEYHFEMGDVTTNINEDKNSAKLFYFYDKNDPLFSKKTITSSSLNVDEEDIEKIRICMLCNTEGVYGNISNINDLPSGDNLYDILSIVDDLTWRINKENSFFKINYNGRQRYWVKNQATEDEDFLKKVALEGDKIVEIDNDNNVYSIYETCFKENTDNWVKIDKIDSCEKDSIDMDKMPNIVFEKYSNIENNNGCEEGKTNWSYIYNEEETLLNGAYLINKWVYKSKSKNKDDVETLNSGGKKIEKLSGDIYRIFSLEDSDDSKSFGAITFNNLVALINEGSNIFEENSSTRYVVDEDNKKLYLLEKNDGSNTYIYNIYNDVSISPKNFNFDTMAFDENLQTIGYNDESIIYIKKDDNIYIKTDNENNYYLIKEEYQYPSYKKSGTVIKVENDGTIKKYTNIKLCFKVKRMSPNIIGSFWIESSPEIYEHPATEESESYSINKDDNNQLCLFKNKIEGELTYEWDENNYYDIEEDEPSSGKMSGEIKYFVKKDEDDNCYMYIYNSIESGKYFILKEYCSNCYDKDYFNKHCSVKVNDKVVVCIGHKCVIEYDSDSDYSNDTNQSISLQINDECDHYNSKVIVPKEGIIIDILFIEKEKNNADINNDDDDNDNNQPSSNNISIYSLGLKDKIKSWEY